jgi:hypothetical protein
VTVDFGVEQGAIPVGGRGRNTNEIGSGSRKKKKKRNEKNVIGGGGNAMGQTISVVQPHTTKFQRLIEKWEPKFEKWDRAIQLMEGQLSNNHLCIEKMAMKTTSLASSVRMVKLVEQGLMVKLAGPELMVEQMTRTAYRQGDPLKNPEVVS